MIEGLKVTITGTVLQDLCLKRAEHHRARAKTYNDQLESLQENQIEGMNYSNGDPKRVISERLEQHTSEAGEMEFVAKYIDLGENYLLGRDDLHKLGIYKAKFSY